MTENWKPVVGHEGLYEVSDIGRVRSLSRSFAKTNGVRLTVNGRVLKPWLSKGYPTVTLRNGREGITRQVHRLVLAAFIGPCPEGMEGCHGDGDPTNNALDNLRWDTSSACKFDIVRHGHHYSASKRTCPLGHLLVAPNLVRSSLLLGSRQCRACNQGHAYANLHGVPFRAAADERYAQLMEEAA